MSHTAMRNFTIKFIGYSAFLLYLTGDLFLWHGFFASKIDSYVNPVSGRAGDTSATAVQVYGEHITQNQLKHRIEELRLLRQEPTLDMGEGITMTKEQPDMTSRAKYDLISSALLRLKAGYNDLQLPNRSPAAVAIEQATAKRFGTDREQYLKTLHEQNSTPERFKKQVEARLKQTEHLYRVTAQAANPTEEELRAYYEAIKDQLTSPARREVRHIFLPVLNQDPQLVQQQAQDILNRIQAGESFADLARELSQDARSAPLGGDLGEVDLQNARDLLGLELAEVPDNTPVLVPSRWGWHIVQAGPIVPGNVPEFQAVRPALLSAAQSLRRAKAVDLYMDNVMEEAHLHRRIKHAAPTP